MTEPKVHGLIEEAARVLTETGRVEAADDLRRLLSELRHGSEQQRVAAREAIVQRCHIGWLGDLNIQYGAEPYGWINFLGDIQRRLDHPNVARPPNPEER